MPIKENKTSTLIAIHFAVAIHFTLGGVSCLYIRNKIESFSYESFKTEKDKVLALQ